MMNDSEIKRYPNNVAKFVCYFVPLEADMRNDGNENENKNFIRRELLYYFHYGLY